MKIVLLGYMGSGKSTVGKKLAAQLGIPFTDLDDYIEESLGNSIPEIFLNKGEIFFRKQEHLYLRKILESEGDKVIALGGGTPCYSNNMNLILEKTPHVFYLSVPIPELNARLLTGKADRPLIRDLKDEELPEFIGKHLFERRNYYSLATHTIQAGGKEVHELVSEIVTLL
ncbi:shikimate kinase [Zeaxanthinibacter enoshimensis]|uniref:Shikimate kinase n=1 Tax=Zeaxanthinibacter enoshimensis TaxID=392009 RepID=A0A4R6TKF0_9FLAO|nr:shikimate kinase [Zeaxanthinibacter enoshimensis]TDQ30922.1 shikimate kinase [Zeaxanthinibacter enoshimensis]